MILEIVAGIAFALPFIWLARGMGHAEMPILAVGLVIAALAYDGFGAALAGSTGLTSPAWSTATFSTLAVLGVVVSPGFLAAGWALHAGWDFLLPTLADVAFMPTWYDGLCVGFDLVCAGYLAARTAGRLPLDVDAIPSPAEPSP